MTEDELIEVGRKAIEDVLVSYRDNYISMMGCGNGLVIRYRDGRSSDIIRLSTADALRIAIRAMFPDQFGKPQEPGASG